MEGRKPRIFFMMSYFSHQNCTFLTARKLVQAHYDVSYCGPPESADGDNMTLNVTKQGFNYIELDPRNKRFYSSHFLRNKYHENTQSMFLSLLYNLQDGRLYQEFVKKHQPDLIILDVHYMPLIMPFTFHRIPVLLASTKINMDKYIGLPPVNTSLLPDTKSENNVEVEVAWQKELEQKQRFDKYFDFLEDIAEKYKFDFDRFFYREKAIVPFGFRFPELIFWDLEFDFARSKEGLRDKYYLGNQVEISRHEDRLPIIDQDIIYVSLGSRLNNLTSTKLALLEEIIKVANDLTDYQFVIATSTFQDQLQGHVSSSNVTLLEYAPQLLYLSRSLLMITHAGGNSVKECIRMGVPMLCYPFEHDQFGNAARVVYHKIGLRGDNIQDKADTIRNKLLTILNNKEFKNQIAKFQKRAVEAEESNDDIEVIRHFIDR